MSRRHRLGQHFLASPEIARKIAASAEVAPGTRVLEIGPGRGVLTDALVAAGADVTAIEVDRTLAAGIRERFPSVRLVEGDALQADLASLLPGSGWRCVSNLPYSVGTPLVTRMLALPGTFGRLVVMLQKEVAARLVAPPGSRDRGSLSVYAQARARVRALLRVRPGSFHPPPEVDSAVVELLLFEAPVTAGASVAAFDRLVRAAFSAPRKTVLNALSGAYDRSEAASALASSGIDPGARAATLDLADFGRLARALGESRPVGEPSP